MTTPARVELPSVRPQDLATEAIALVRRWLEEGSRIPVDASAAQLAGVLKDPNGLAFTVGFVDGVVRPEDLSVAARNLKALAPKVPAFLPWYMKSAVALPNSDVRPLVVTKLATELAFAGMRHEPPVVSQIEQVARFAATEAPAPPLLPPGVRSVS